jgi:YD repeat-containing protein
MLTRISAVPEYDALSQLVSRTESRSDQEMRRTLYDYDPVGNRVRLSEFMHGAPPSVTMYAYDAADALLHAGNIRFTYDANGNRLIKAESGGLTTHYAYDAANRLVRVSQSGTEVTYAYDGDGNKVERTLSGGQAEVLRFVNDGLGRTKVPKVS